MDITNINLGTCPLQYLSVGYVGETGARPVAFDFSAWAAEYGSGVLQLLLQRPGDANPYPVVLDIDGTTATWTPDATATEKTGQGQAQLIYTVGGVIVKNAIFRVLIAPSLGAAGDPPEPYEDWLEQLTELAAETQQSALDAAESAEAAGTSAGAAAGSAGAAAQSAAGAEAAKTGAEAAEQTAQQSATLARAKAAEAAEAAQIAGREADYAQQQNIAAGYSAESAHDDAELAAQSAEDAQAAAADAAAAVTEVETKGAEQIAAINQAGTTQIAAVDVAGAAQVQAIEDKGEEVIASIPSDYTELADDVSDLKSSLNELLPTNLIDSITDLNKYVSYNDGKLYNSNTSNVTGYIDVSNYTELVYSQTNVPSSSAYFGIAFYDNDKVYISGVRCVRNAPSNFYTESEVNVPQNAKYIRMTVFHTSAVNGAEPYLYSKEDFDSSLPERVQSVESELSIASSEFEGVKKDGYYTIPVDKWAVGGWLSYNSSDSRQYRVRCNEALEFDCDTFILADVGYKVSGYKLVNGSSVSLDGSTILKIPANTSVKIYARRFTEDTSEVVSNVTPFANAIKFSTALAPIELYQPTFTDVSMFERMGVGGDSYANGGGYISGVRSLTWGKNLERQAGITVDIYARSGEGVVGWNADTTQGLPALLAGEECGLYWLQHGINGTSTAAAIGTPEDMSASPHPSTFYGQYVEAIEQIKTTFPDARIVIATIIGSDWELAQNTQYSKVNTAVKNIAQYCEIPCIDITTDDFFRSLFYRNGIQSNHPSAMLCAGMAMAYRRLISKCIQENPSYFLEYGFTE